MAAVADLLDLCSGNDSRGGIELWAATVNETTRSVAPVSTRSPERWSAWTSIVQAAENALRRKRFHPTHVPAVTSH
jgi:hypothetical protein